VAATIPGRERVHGSAARPSVYRLPQPS